MKINKKLEAAKLELLLEGRLDTTTSPMHEAELKQSIEGSYRAGIQILRNWNIYLQLVFVFCLQHRKS